MGNRIQELRMKVSPAKIKEILEYYDITPFSENENFIVFPTRCHNDIGGSPKLFYYTNTCLFNCFTECNRRFDIFEFVQLLEARKGNTLTLPDVIQGFGASPEDIRISEQELMAQDANYLEEIGLAMQNTTNEDLKPLELSLLRNFVYDEVGLSSWLKEGISTSSIKKYDILYDQIRHAITVPQHDSKGNLVGIRGRFLGEDAVAKYKPLAIDGTVFSHPIRKTLYGYHHNKAAIQEKGTVVLFEGEKSVLKMDTIYGDSNLSLASCGKVISKEHIQLLLKLRINSFILAFDADYRNEEEFNAKLEEYTGLVSRLSKYFTVSIIMDSKGLLDYKDSPIDKGKDIFSQLMKERIYI